MGPAGSNFVHPWFPLHKRPNDSLKGGAKENSLGLCSKVVLVNKPVLSLTPPPSRHEVAQASRLQFPRFLGMGNTGMHSGTHGQQLCPLVVSPI
jgi:hypothetical protein